MDRIYMSYVGAYNSASTYEQNDLVSYGGNFYISLGENTGVSPDSDSTKFAVFGGSGSSLKPTFPTFWAGNSQVAAGAATPYGGIDGIAGSPATASSFGFKVQLIRVNINCFGAQDASGSLVATLYVNGQATSVVLTIAAGAASGTNQPDDLSANPLVINPTDTIYWVVKNNATVASTHISGVSFFERLT